MALLRFCYLTRRLDRKIKRYYYNIINLYLRQRSRRSPMTRKFLRRSFFRDGRRTRMWDRHKIDVCRSPVESYFYKLKQMTFCFPSAHDLANRSDNPPCLLFAPNKNH